MISDNISKDFIDKFVGLELEFRWNVAIVEFGSENLIKFFDTVTNLIRTAKWKNFVKLLTVFLNLKVQTTLNFQSKF